MQATCFAVNGDADARASRPRMAEAIRRIGSQIAASKRFIGPDVRLVVLPEYFLTGFPMGEPTAVWSEKACLAPGGPEYRALGEIARANDVFLAGNALVAFISFIALVVIVISKADAGKQVSGGKPDHAFKVFSGD